jgi:hypothetical protein
LSDVDIPILGQRVTRSPAQQAHDQRLAEWFARAAKAALNGEITAAACSVFTAGEKVPSTLIHDDFEKRMELIGQLVFLTHALTTTEHNWRMASLPGGEPVAAPSIGVAR